MKKIVFLLLAFAVTLTLLFVYTQSFAAERGQNSRHGGGFHQDGGSHGSDNFHRGGDFRRNDGFYRDGRNFSSYGRYGWNGGYRGYRGFGLYPYFGVGFTNPYYPYGLCYGLIPVQYRACDAYGNCWIETRMIYSQVPCY